MIQMRESVSSATKTLAFSCWRRPVWKTLSRIITLVVTLSFTFPYLTWAFESPTFSRPDSVLFKSQSVDIPRALGIVAESHQGTGDTLVVHIQDLHCNYEVQSNIARLIDLLAKRHGLNLVGIEGASRPVNVTKLSTFPDPAVKREAGDCFVRRGRMSGAEYYAATGGKPVRLEGLEDPELYRASYERVLAFLNDENQGCAADLRQALDEVRRRTDTGELLKLDARERAFRGGELSLLRYALFLKSRAERLGLKASEYSQVALYCSRRSEKFDGRLDADRLLTELERLNARLREALYENEAQRDLDLRLRRLDVMEKLINISATPGEVAEYRREPEAYRVKPFDDFLAGQNTGAEAALDAEVYRLDEAVRQAAEFYRLADRRSLDFVSRLTGRMRARNAQIAVMITGGFHTAQVLERLRAAGVSYLSVRPRLTRQDWVNPYFSLLRRRPDSLERLLAPNQKIFSLPPYFAETDQTDAVLRESELPADMQAAYRLLEAVLKLDALAHWQRRGTTGLQPLIRHYRDELARYRADSGALNPDLENILMSRGAFLVDFPSAGFFAVLGPAGTARTPDAAPVQVLTFGALEIAFFKSELRPAVARRFQARSRTAAGGAGKQAALWEAAFPQWAANHGALAAVRRALSGGIARTAERLQPVRTALGREAIRRLNGAAETQTPSVAEPHSLFTLAEGAPGEAAFASDYSRFKLGDARVARNYSEALIRTIAGDLGGEIRAAPRDWVAVNIGGAGALANPAQILSREIARHFGIPYVTLKPKPNEDDQSTYEGNAYNSRDQVYVNGMHDASAASLRGKKVLLIDDAFVTGTMLGQALRILQERGCGRVESYVVVRMLSDKQNEYENAINRWAIDRGGVRLLAEYLNSAETIITTRLIFYALKSDPETLPQLLPLLTPAARLNLYLYSLEYFGPRSPETVTRLAAAVKKDTGCSFSDARTLNRIRSGEFFAEVDRALGKYGDRVPLEAAKEMHTEIGELLAQSADGRAAVSIDLSAKQPVGFAETRIREGLQEAVGRSNPDGSPVVDQHYRPEFDRAIRTRDGLEILLSFVAENKRGLKGFAAEVPGVMHPHPASGRPCLFCELLGEDSPIFFDRVNGAEGHRYRLSVNKNERRASQLMMVAEDKLPNVFIDPARVKDMLLFTVARGVDYEVRANSQGGGPSQGGHYHFHSWGRQSAVWKALDGGRAHIAEPRFEGDEMEYGEVRGWPARCFLYRGRDLDALARIAAWDAADMSRSNLPPSILTRVLADGTCELLAMPEVFDPMSHVREAWPEMHRRYPENTELGRWFRQIQENLAPEMPSGNLYFNNSPPIPLTREQENVLAEFMSFAMRTLSDWNWQPEWAKETPATAAAYQALIDRAVKMPAGVMPVITLDGIPGTGKTTSALTLARKLEAAGYQAAVLHLDWFIDARHPQLRRAVQILLVSFLSLPIAKIIPDAWLIRLFRRLLSEETEMNRVLDEIKHFAARRGQGRTLRMTIDDSLAPQEAKRKPPELMLNDKTVLVVEGFLAAWQCARMSSPALRVINVEVTAEDSVIRERFIRRGIGGGSSEIYMKLADWLSVPKTLYARVRSALPFDYRLDVTRPERISFFRHERPALSPAAGWTAMLGNGRRLLNLLLQVLMVFGPARGPVLLPVRRITNPAAVSDLIGRLAEADRLRGLGIKSRLGAPVDLRRIAVKEVRVFSLGDLQLACFRRLALPEYTEYFAAILDRRNRVIGHAVITVERDEPSVGKFRYLIYPDKPGELLEGFRAQGYGGQTLRLIVKALAGGRLLGPQYQLRSARFYTDDRESRTSAWKDNTAFLKKYGFRECDLGMQLDDISLIDANRPLEDKIRAALVSPYVRAILAAAALGLLGWGLGIGFGLIPFFVVQGGSKEKREWPKAAAAFKSLRNRLERLRSDLPALREAEERGMLARAAIQRELLVGLLPDPLRTQEETRPFTALPEMAATLIRALTPLAQYRDTLDYLNDFLTATIATNQGDVVCVNNHQGLADPMIAALQKQEKAGGKVLVVNSDLHHDLGYGRTRSFHLIKDETASPEMEQADRAANWKDTTDKPWARSNWLVKVLENTQCDRVIQVVPGTGQRHTLVKPYRNRKVTVDIVSVDRLSETLEQAKAEGPYTALADSLDLDATAGVSTDREYHAQEFNLDSLSDPARALFDFFFRQETANELGEIVREIGNLDSGETLAKLVKQAGTLPLPAYSDELLDQCRQEIAALLKTRAAGYYPKYFQALRQSGLPAVFHGFAVSPEFSPLPEFWEENFALALQALQRETGLEIRSYRTPVFDSPNVLGFGTALSLLWNMITQENDRYLPLLLNRLQEKLGDSLPPQLAEQMQSLLADIPSSRQAETPKQETSGAPVRLSGRMLAGFRTIRGELDVLAANPKLVEILGTMRAGKASVLDARNLMLRFLNVLLPEPWDYRLEKRKFTTLAELAEDVIRTMTVLTKSKPGNAYGHAFLPGEIETDQGTLALTTRHHGLAEGMIEALQKAEAHGEQTLLINSDLHHDLGYGNTFDERDLDEYGEKPASFSRALQFGKNSRPLEAPKVLSEDNWIAAVLSRTRCDRVIQVVPGRQQKTEIGKMIAGRHVKVVIVSADLLAEVMEQARKDNYTSFANSVDLDTTAGVYIQEHEFHVSDFNLEALSPRARNLFDFFFEQRRSQDVGKLWKTICDPGAEAEAVQKWFARRTDPAQPLPGINRLEGLKYADLPAYTPEELRRCVAEIREMLAGRARDYYRSYFETLEQSGLKTIFRGLALSTDFCPLADFWAPNLSLALGEFVRSSGRTIKGYRVPAFDAPALLDQRQGFMLVWNLIAGKVANADVSLLDGIRALLRNRLPDEPRRIMEETFRQAEQLTAKTADLNQADRGSEQESGDRLTLPSTYAFAARLSPRLARDGDLHRVTEILIAPWYEFRLKYLLHPREFLELHGEMTPAQRYRRLMGLGCMYGFGLAALVIVWSLTPFIGLAWAGMWPELVAGLLGGPVAGALAFIAAHAVYNWRVSSAPLTADKKPSGPDAYVREHLPWFRDMFADYAAHDILSERGQALLATARRPENLTSDQVREMNAVMKYFKSIPAMDQKRILDRFPQDYFIRLNIPRNFRAYDSKLDRDRQPENRRVSDLALKAVEGCPNVCLTCPVQSSAAVDCMPYPMVIMAVKAGVRFTRSTYFEALYYQDKSGALYGDVLKLTSGGLIIHDYGYRPKNIEVARRNLQYINSLKKTLLVTVSLLAADVGYFSMKARGATEDEIVEAYVKRYQALITDLVAGKHIIHLRDYRLPEEYLNSEGRAINRINRRVKDELETWMEKNFFRHILESSPDTKHQILNSRVYGYVEDIHKSDVWHEAVYSPVFMGEEQFVLNADGRISLATPPELVPYEEIKSLLERKYPEINRELIEKIKHLPKEWEVSGAKQRVKVIREDDYGVTQTLVWLADKGMEAVARDYIQEEVKNNQAPVIRTRFIHDTLSRPAANARDESEGAEAEEACFLDREVENLTAGEMETVLGLTAGGAGAVLERMWRQGKPSGWLNEAERAARTGEYPTARRYLRGYMNFYCAWDRLPATGEENRRLLAILNDLEDRSLTTSRMQVWRQALRTGGEWELIKRGIALLDKLQILSDAELSRQFGLFQTLVDTLRWMPAEAAGDLERETLVLDGRFEIGTMIGSGKDGQIYRAYDRGLKKAVVVKIASPVGKRQAIAKEWSLLADLRSRERDRGVIGIYAGGWWRDDRLNRNVFYIVEEDGGPTAADLENRMSAADMLDFFCGVLEAVNEIHAAGVVHADLHAHNITVPQLDESAYDFRHPRLIDFGSAKRLPEGGGELVRSLIRVDLEAIGQMIETLGGGNPRLNRDPDFRKLVRRFDSPDAGERYPSLEAALAAVREYRTDLSQSREEKDAARPGGIMPAVKQWWVERGGSSAAERALRGREYDTRVAFWLELFVASPLGLLFWLAVGKGYRSRLSQTARRTLLLTPLLQLGLMAAGAYLALATGDLAVLQLGLASLWAAFLGYHYLEGPDRARAPGENKLIAIVLFAVNLTVLVLTLSLPLSCWLGVLIAAGLGSHALINSDARTRSGWIAAIRRQTASALRRAPEAAASGPRMRPLDERAAHGLMLRIIRALENRGGSPDIGVMPRDVLINGQKRFNGEEKRLNHPYFAGVVRVGPLVLVLLKTNPAADHPLFKKNQVGDMEAYIDGIRSLQKRLGSDYAENAGNILFAAYPELTGRELIRMHTLADLGSQIENAARIEGAVVADLESADGILGRLALRLGAARAVFAGKQKCLDLAHLLLAVQDGIDPARDPERAVLLNTNLNDPDLPRLLENLRRPGRPLAILVNNHGYVENIYELIRGFARKLSARIFMDGNYFGETDAGRSGDEKRPALAAGEAGPTPAWKNRELPERLCLYDAEKGCYRVAKGAEWDGVTGDGGVMVSTGQDREAPFRGKFIWRDAVRPGVDAIVIPLHGGSSIYVEWDRAAQKTVREIVTDYMPRKTPQAAAWEFASRRYYGPGHALLETEYADGTRETAEDYRIFRGNLNRFMDLNEYNLPEIVRPALEAEKGRRLSSAETDEMLRCLRDIGDVKILLENDAWKQDRGYPHVCRGSAGAIFEHLCRRGWPVSRVDYFAHTVVEIEIAGVRMVIDGTAGQWDIRKDNYRNVWKETGSVDYYKILQNQYRQTGITILPYRLMRDIPATLPGHYFSDRLPQRLIHYDPERRWEISWGRDQHFLRVNEGQIEARTYRLSGDGETERTEVLFVQNPDEPVKLDEESADGVDLAEAEEYTAEFIRNELQPVGVAVARYAAEKQKRSLPVLGWLWPVLGLAAGIAGLTFGPDAGIWCGSALAAGFSALGLGYVLLRLPLAWGLRQPADSVFTRADLDRALTKIRGMPLFTPKPGLASLLAPGQLPSEVKVEVIRTHPRRLLLLGGRSAYYDAARNTFFFHANFKSLGEAEQLPVVAHELMHYLDDRGEVPASRWSRWPGLSVLAREWRAVLAERGVRSALDLGRNPAEAVLNRAAKRPAGPEKDHPSPEERTPLAAITEALDLGRVGEDPAVKIVGRARHGEVSTVTFEMPPRADRNRRPEGLEILQNELGDYTRFDLVYALDGRLLAVFPAPENGFSKADAGKDETPSKIAYLDLRHYAFAPPSPEDSSASEQWENYRRGIREDRDRLLEYMFSALGPERKRAVPVDHYMRQKPFVLCSWDSENGEWRTREIDERTSDENPRPRQEGRVDFILSVFPTVYSPGGSHEHMDRYYYEALAREARLRPGQDALVVGPGSGTDVRVVWEKTRKTVCAIGENPMEVAATRYNVARQGGETEAVVGNNIVDENLRPVIPNRRFDRVFWNMPYFERGERPEEQKTYPVLHDIWDRDYNGESLRRFLHGLPKVLKPGGFALVWNDSLTDYRIDALERETGVVFKRLHENVFQITVRSDQGGGRPDEGASGRRAENGPLPEEVSDTEGFAPGRAVLESPNRLLQIWRGPRAAGIVILRAALSALSAAARLGGIRPVARASESAEAQNRLAELKRRYFPWDSGESRYFSPEQITVTELAEGNLWEQAAGRYRNHSAAEPARLELASALWEALAWDDVRAKSGWAGRIAAWRARVGRTLVGQILRYHSSEYYKLTPGKLVLYDLGWIDDLDALTPAGARFLKNGMKPAPVWLLGPAREALLRRVHAWIMEMNPAIYAERMRRDLERRRPELAARSALRREVIRPRSSAVSMSYQRLCRHPSEAAVLEFVDAVNAWLRLRYRDGADIGPDLAYLSELLRGMRWLEFEVVARREKPVAGVAEFGLPAAAVRREGGRIGGRWSALLDAKSFRLIDRFRLRRPQRLRAALDQAA